MNSPMGNRTSHFQSSKEKEIGAISEGYIVPFLSQLLENAKLNNGWRINWATIGRSWREVISIASDAANLNLHLAPEPHALARSGCWITVKSYLIVLPVLVTRVVVETVKGVEGFLIGTEAILSVGIDQLIAQN